MSAANLSITAYCLMLKSISLSTESVISSTLVSCVIFTTGVLYLKLSRHQLQGTSFQCLTNVQLPLHQANLFQISVSWAYKFKLLINCYN